MQWEYLPKAPTLARGPDGKPQYSLIDAAGMVMLALTAEFGLDEGALDRLRVAIAKTIAPEKGDDTPVSPSAIQLRPAPFSIERATLALENADGVRKELASVTPSGFGRQSAAFMINASGPEAEALKAALTGDKGRLTIRYEGSRRRTHGRRSPDGRIADVLGGAARPRDDAEADDMIARASTSGALKLDSSSDPGVTPELCRTVADNARKLAAQGLARMAPDEPPGAAGSINAAARKTEQANVPFTAECDVKF